MVRFVAILETSEDADRVFDVGFLHDDRLKAALEGRILFDVLAVFVQRGGSNAMQFASSERRLQQVGRVHGSFAGCRHRRRCAVRR